MVRMMGLHSGPILSNITGFKSKELPSFINNCINCFILIWKEHKDDKNNGLKELNNKFNVNKKEPKTKKIIN